MENGSATGTQVIDRAVAILDLLRESGSPLGVHEVARRLNLRPPTAHRLLQALVRHDLLQQHPISRAYWFGWKMADYANSLLHNTELATVATDLIKGLRDLTGETAAIQMRVGLDRVCVMEFESQHDLRRALGVGRRIPLHAGASGRTIMAFLPFDELTHLLTISPPQATANYNVLDLDRIYALLDETRQTGLGRSEPNEEQVEGIAALSTPFFGSNRVVIGAISISGPSGRWTRDVMAHYESDALRAGADLSRRLGMRETLPWQPSIPQGPMAKI